MMMKSTHDSPILVTGAAGAIGAIGRNLTAMLLAKGHKVRALVRREDERADALRRLGAEVVQGDLTDLASMHRAIEGCARIYFGMSVSAVYLEATVNTAAVARHHGSKKGFFDPMQGTRFGYVGTRSARMIGDDV